MNKPKDIQGHGLVSHKQAGGMETFGINLSKKCERLATAIYLVTNFLSDTEPMKSRLRTLSIDFVRDASSVRHGSHATEAVALDTLRANIGETLSLLELAFIAGLVSEMNFTILKREYRTLRDTIDIKKASRESHTDTILGDTFFGSSFHEESVSGTRSELTRTREGRSLVPPSTPAPEGRPFVSTSNPALMSDRTPKGQQSPKPASQGLTFMNPSPRSDLRSPTPASRTQRSELTGNPEGRTFMNSSHAPTSALSPRSELTRTREGRILVPSSASIPHSIQKDSRRARILKLIKDNREVAIKDIVAHFPDVSEKTIQRELVAMSDSNVLKKSGERRWSRYSIV